MSTGPASKCWCPYKKRTQRSHVKTGRDWSEAAINQGMPGALAAGSVKERQSRSTGESTALLRPRFQASRLQTWEGINSCCLKATWSVVLCYHSSGKLIEDLEGINVQGMTVTFRGRSQPKKKSGNTCRTW